jgi:hypothetical protein
LGEGWTSRGTIAAKSRILWGRNNGPAIPDNIKKKTGGGGNFKKGSALQEILQLKTQQY